MTSVGYTVFRRIGQFGIGIFIKKGSDFLFDYVLYPWALVYFGILAGGAFMTIASAAFNIFAIRIYDYYKTDVLFIESLKFDDDRVNFSPFFRMILVRGKLAMFIWLSWIEDPIVVTLYYRKGSNLFNGMAVSDWRNFASSTILSNLLWIFSISSILEVLSYIFLNVHLLP